MDDLSDGEGDEEEALRARAAMEVQEDRAQTRKLISAVTEGFDATRKNLKKGKYSLNKLLAEPLRKTNSLAEGPADDDGEYDEEEALQRGFQLRGEREQQESSDSEADEASDGEQHENEIKGECLLALRCKC